MSTENKYSEELMQKISRLPQEPGIYQYFDKNDKIIYIGKAKKLRNRVRSYFQKRDHMDAKTRILVQKIVDLEYIVVDNEAEALILEDTLIKKHKPRYNIMLKDDKTYPYIRITNEEYPRIFSTRTVIRDGSKYFGPYTELKPMKQILRILRSLFLLRSCDLKLTSENIREGKYKVCLDYHIDKCNGICEGKISKEEYLQNIQISKRILQGRTKDLEKELLAKMEEYSDELEFEKAAMIKEKYLLLKEFSANQKIVSTDLVDRDIFVVARVEESACSLVFKVREGKLIGKRHFIIKNAENEEDASIMQKTIEKWYLETDFVPKEIFLSHESEDLEYLTDWLAKKREKNINIHIPKLGDKRKFVDMAISNAEFILKEYKLAMMKREQTVPRPVIALQRDLRLKDVPRRIECFDNSHMQGTDLVSSLVVFEDGRPKKSDYRKFKIKTVEGNDDFAAMREAVTRRYTRLIEEKSPLPDMIIVDGGKGQLSSAYEIIKGLGIADKVILVGLAKRLEEVFFPGESEAVLLPKTSSSLQLLQRVRDEAHRFAITFHRSLRSKRTLKTELTEIEGIGELTAQKLLKEFGSVENIKSKTQDELAKIIRKNQAEKILVYFSANKSKES